MSKTRTLFGVLLPAVQPSVILGIPVATPISLVITVLVEYLTAVNGLDALVGDAPRTFQPARVYALIAIAGLLSLTVNALVRGLEGGVMRRRVGDRP